MNILACFCLGELPQMEQDTFPELIDSQGFPIDVLNTLALDKVKY